MSLQISTNIYTNLVQIIRMIRLSTQAFICVSMPIMFINSFIMFIISFEIKLQIPWKDRTKTHPMIREEYGLGSTVLSKTQKERKKQRAEGRSENRERPPEGLTVQNVVHRAEIGRRLKGSAECVAGQGHTRRARNSRREEGRCGQGLLMNRPRDEWSLHLVGVCLKTAITGFSNHRTSS